jgi:hypothetical protein
MRTMRGRLFRMSFAIAVASSCCLGAPSEARATLGGDVASVATNQQRMAATRQVKKLASGERHELQLASGIVIHEYVSTGGEVYAITWRGPRMPDLRELLGRYFTQLDHRDSRQRGGHHRMTLTGSDLVIQSSGHRRSFVGRAWVPSLVPSSVNLDNVLE